MTTTSKETGMETECTSVISKNFSFGHLAQIHTDILSYHLWQIIGISQPFMLHINSSPLSKEHESIPVFHLLGLLIPQALEVASGSPGSLSIICWHLSYHANYISLIIWMSLRKMQVFFCITYSFLWAAWFFITFLRTAHFRISFLHSHKHFMAVVLNFFCIRNLLEDLTAPQDLRRTFLRTCTHLYLAFQWLIDLQRTAQRTEVHWIFIL